MNLQMSGFCQAQNDYKRALFFSSLTDFVVMTALNLFYFFFSFSVPKISIFEIKNCLISTFCFNIEEKHEGAITYDEQYPCIVKYPYQKFNEIYNVIKFLITAPSVD